MEALLTTYSIQISIFLRIVSCVLLLFFCIPLQVKEAQVKNGLRKLRFQLLAFGIILFLTNLFYLGCLWLALDVVQNPINAFLQIVNAVAFLVLSVIGHLMYRTQYTDEAKDVHEEIEARERNGVVQRHYAKETAQHLLNKAKVKADELLQNPKQD